MRVRTEELGPVLGGGLDGSVNEYGNTVNLEYHGESADPDAEKICRGIFARMSLVANFSNRGILPNKRKRRK